MPEDDLVPEEPQYPQLPSLASCKKAAFSAGSQIIAQKSAAQKCIEGVDKEDCDRICFRDSLHCWQTEPGMCALGFRVEKTWLLAVCPRKVA